MTTNTPLVIYHAPCIDGITAAWACRKAHPDWDFRPQSHGGDFLIMDAIHRDVYLLDFTFPRQDMVSLACVANSITVLDHHKTAMESMENFADVLHDLHLTLPVNLIYDMQRSGAMMAWDHFHPGERAPELVRYVQDHDLWTKALPNTDEVHATLSSYDQTFENWDLLEREHLSGLIADGMAILRKNRADIKLLISEGKRQAEIAGHLVPVVNAPPKLASEICHAMAGGVPFAASYYDTAGGRLWSLRSRKDEDGIDVGEIARQLGGGGHKHAAGFRSDLNWAGDNA